MQSFILFEKLSYSENETPFKKKERKERNVSLDTYGSRNVNFEKIIRINCINDIFYL